MLRMDAPHLLAGPNNRKSMGAALGAPPSTFSRVEGYTVGEGVGDRNNIFIGGNGMRGIRPGGLRIGNGRDSAVVSGSGVAVCV